MLEFTNEISETLFIAQLTLIGSFSTMEYTISAGGILASTSLCDEDIPAITPSPIVNEDAPIVTKKNQSNEIRIGPITRARAKLLEQQVNLFLNEPDVLLMRIL